ncbi:MAG TPA: HIT domain-containing protein [Cellvibrionaceae bacterium]|nr:HIT domain-containing protein [Cellvibrionaceae bacterium]
MFELHPQLKADSYLIGKFSLSWVLLHKDATYPWVILVPAREDLREIHHLYSDDQISLMRESCHLSEVMVDLFAPKKLNVAAIGNIVSQLHLHHVARFEQDPAWPKPIWGLLPATGYSEELRLQRINQLRSALVGEGFIAQDHWS